MDVDEMTAIDGQALSMIIQLVQEPIVLATKDYVILHLNALAQEQLNQAQQDLIGTSLTELCPVDELNQLSNAPLVKIKLKTKHQAGFCYVILIKNLQPDLALNPYLESIISQIPVSVYWMNKEYIYQGCSNSMANLLHLSSRHEIVGKTYEDLYDKKSSDSYKQADKSVIEDGLSISIEEPLYQPDGSKLVYLSKKVPLRDAQGHVIGMLGISTEITDRKKMG